MFSPVKCNFSNPQNIFAKTGRGNGERIRCFEWFPVKYESLIAFRFCHFLQDTTFLESRN